MIEAWTCRALQARSWRGRSSTRSPAPRREGVSGYDGDLKRHAVVEDGTPTYYLWNGLRLLETRNADHTLKARFTHGLARIEGIGSCVEIHRASDSKRY